MNRLLFLTSLGLFPVLALAQAIPPAIPAPTTNLPAPTSAPTVNLPSPTLAPNPLVVPVASMYLSASQTFVSRGSTATYFDNTGTLQTAAVHTPRYDYDPVTHVAKGILVEPRRTNLLSNSDFQNDQWEQGAIIVTSSVPGPDGSMMKKVTSKSSMSSAITHNKKIAVNPDTNYVISVHYKADTVPYILLELSDKVTYSAGLFVNTSTGALSTITSGVGITISGYGIADMGNGIYRVWLGAKFHNLPRPQTFRIGLRDNKTGVQTVVSGTGVYLWGAQLEQGISPTSYIPAINAPTTRVQDVYQQITQ